MNLPLDGLPRETKGNNLGTGAVDVFIMTKEMAGAHIDKVTSSRHRSVAETGRSQHSQDKQEESSPDKRGRLDFVQDCNFVQDYNV